MRKLLSVIIILFSCTSVSIEGEWSVTHSYVLQNNSTMKRIENPFAQLIIRKDSVWIDSLGTVLTKRNEGDGNHLLFSYKNSSYDFLIKSISSEGLTLESSIPFEDRKTIFLLKR